MTSRLNSTTNQPPIPSTPYQNPNHQHSRNPAMPDAAPTANTRTHSTADKAVASTSAAAMPIGGSEEDLLLSRSEYLTRDEVIRRRSRRLKQLIRIYKDCYWSLMEDVKVNYRDYYWDFGKSPYEDEGERDNDHDPNGNDDLGLGLKNNDNGGGQCAVHGCKSKAMALTKFCHNHILSDAKQKLYIGCNYVIKSSQAGPILCGKPILRSTVPSLCPLHFQKAEKHVARALKKAGLNSNNTSKVAPKFHVIVAEYVNQIQAKRRAAQREMTSNSESKEDEEISI